MLHYWFFFFACPQFLIPTSVSQFFSHFGKFQSVFSITVWTSLMWKYKAKVLSYLEAFWHYHDVANDESLSKCHALLIHWKYLQATPKKCMWDISVYLRQGFNPKNISLYMLKYPHIWEKTECNFLQSQS